MRVEFQILAAFVVDLLFGDPRWLPHPVKLIGRFALSLETPMRKLIPRMRAAGIAATIIVVGLTGLISWILIKGAAMLHPVAGDAMSILLLYTTFASRDLLQHSYRVYAALRDGNLEEAKRRVSLLVGRDTDCLDEYGVTRAAVESVAENLVDGVTAPIFFAVLGGPVVAMMYKAVNTLDSTFGYKDERYLLFGWASARLDDVANYLPARLTAPLMALAAAILGYRPMNSIQICLRDGRKHPSPNAGLSEAAMAGALGIQLGGLNYYGGEAFEGALIGDSIQKMNIKDILAANVVMLGTSLLCLLLLTAARVALSNFLRGAA
jgi:adenosylcobinamide-phosphate synthase